MRTQGNSMGQWGRQVSAKGGSLIPARSPLGPAGFARENSEILDAKSGVGVGC